MSIALDNRIARRADRAMTLIEILVAIAITLAFLGGVVLAFIQLMDASERAQARLNATANARHALETMGTEISRALGNGPDVHFAGVCLDLAQGDRANNDSDADVDEEVVNGHDDDGDWAAANDRHAQIGPFYERSVFRTLPDLGDGNLDEDNRFTSATLDFRTDPSTPPGTSRRTVRYLLGSYDGEPNVLLQEVTLDVPGPLDTVTTSPIAFGVLSFEALFWDQQEVFDMASDNGWKKSWNSDSLVPPTPPVSVYLSVTIYAGSPRELSQLQPNEIRETVKLSTIANVQEVLTSGNYAAIRNSYPNP